ncbi:HAD-like domain-containing protein [Ochromonadaceae sp. CCMP2298]|nr:HAD-like domain-containing protein [Ochromonadaceae sp. CCMP2298]|mmetsp:Transcript_12306/g.27402  ORF Transcript_12306/g.27402 Transcript_12306/m.27402 type:complete len:309 (-) Transcript_12306:93-1019(-)
MIAGRALRLRPSIRSHVFVSGMSSTASDEVRKAAPFDASKVKVISLDVTGTLLVHKQSVSGTYADCMSWAKLPITPSGADLKIPFKQAYREKLIEFPAFGFDAGMSDRDWWKAMVRRTVELANKDQVPISEDEFDRFFRRVYQFYGSQEGYACLPDAEEFLHWAHGRYSLGICTNTTERTVETVLPMLRLHDLFHWFVCCRDVGSEKPSRPIFDEAFRQASWWARESGLAADLQRDQVLHVGDNFAADFCGARAAGFQALFLDRSHNPLVTSYRDYPAVDYPGRSDEDIRSSTVTSLTEVMQRLQGAS